MTKNDLAGISDLLNSAQEHLVEAANERTRIYALAAAIIRS